MLLSALSREWFFSRCLRRNKPDEGSGAGAATDLADPALLALIPGADQLPAEEEAVTTQEPGGEERAEQQAGEGEETAEEEQTSEEQTEEKEQTEEEAETDPAKQIDTLTTENEQLKQQLEDAKAAQPAPLLAPTRSNPLANVTDDRGLAANAAFAKQLKQWAFRASKEGGEMPKEIQCALDGVKPEEITEARTLTAEEAQDLYEQADAMLTEHLPARRQYLQEESQATAFLKEHYPKMLDPKSEEGKVFTAFQQQMPEIKLLSRWPTALAATVLGHLQMQREYEAKQKGGNNRTDGANGTNRTDGKAARTVQTTSGKAVPLAPGAGNGGARKAPVAGAAQKKAAEAGQRLLSGKASEADMLTVFSVAE